MYCLFADIVISMPCQLSFYSSVLTIGAIGPYHEQLYDVFFIVDIEYGKSKVIYSDPEHLYMLYAHIRIIMRA